MAKPIQIVFKDWQVTYKDRPNDPSRIVTVGVWIDLEQLAEMAITAAKSKGRKCKDGALNVEVITLRDVPQL